MNKRAIAILGGIFLLIVGTLVFLIIQRSGSDSDTPAVVDEPTVVQEPDVPDVIVDEPVIDKPTISPARAIRLTDDAVVSPILFFQGNGISYFNTQGQLFQTDLQVTDATALLSNKRELSIEQKPGINRILWPAVGNSFIAQIGSDVSPRWSYYDSAKAAYVDLPAEVKSLDWLPGSDQIMFLWVDANNSGTLNISKPDTTEYSTLADSFDADTVIYAAPNGNNILFHRTQSTDQSKNIINNVTADGKTFRTVIADGYNQGVKWSPDSQKFVFTKRNAGGQFDLWFSNFTTGETKNLGVVGQVNKVVWSQDSQLIYAASPKSNSGSFGSVQDIFYQIDVATGSKQEYDPGLSVDGQDLFLNTNGNVLFFRNGLDQSLYYIVL